MKSLFDLNGKVVVITGGHGYFGTAIAEAMLIHGATVMLADIVEKNQDELKIKGKSYERLFNTYCDASDTNSIKALFHKTKQVCGKIDVLINNAYYGTGYGGRFEQMSDDDWHKGLDGAIGTAFRCTREVVPYLEENDGGSIINVASMYGMVSPDPKIYGDSGANNPINYGAGKAAVLQLTRYCAGHLGRKHIRVNSITPGPFPHKDMQESQEDFVRKLGEKTMLGRIGQQDEIAGAAVFLSARSSSYITGANIVVDGGWTAW